MVTSEKMQASKYRFFLLFCPKIWHAKLKLDSREQPAILDGENVLSVFAGQTPKHVFLSVFGSAFVS